MPFQWIFNPASALILSSHYSVDTFLVFSGFLASKSYFKNRTGLKPRSLTKRYLHRYIRLTAPLAAAILLGATTKNLGFGSGPNWKPVANRETQICRTYWWSTLLHIQNYVNPEEIVRLIY